MPIIAIAAGHYKYTAGKRCLKVLDPNQTREWFLNARVAEYLTKLLEDFECEVLRLDDPAGEKCITIQQRAKMANQCKADLYIAIHHNAADSAASKTGNWTGGGITVFHYNKPQRKASATVLYNNLIALTGLRGDRATPVKASTLYEITAPNAPSFLIENGFMDSKTDVPIILSEEHARRTAEAIAAFCVTELKLKDKPVNQEPPKKQNPYPEPVRSLKLNLTKKMSGDDVKWLQWELNRAIGSGLEVDGIFGKLTKEAVIKFQKTAVGLEVDGICGPATRARLREW